jgi:hypothetical protein
MTVLVVLLVATAAVVVAFVVAGVRMAARTVGRVHQVTRRAVDRAVVPARAYGLPPGRGRQVARLRLTLRRELERTGRVLETAAGEHCSLGELPLLFRRVEQLGRSVDAELRMLEAGADTTGPQASAAAHRAEDVVALAAKIRRAAVAAHADLTADAFGSLRGEVDMEVRAVRAGLEVVRRPEARAPSVS